METTNVQNPIYAFGDNRVEPLLLEILPFLGSQPYRMRRVPRKELQDMYKSAYQRGSPVASFLLASGSVKM